MSVPNAAHQGPPGPDPDDPLAGRRVDPDELLLLAEQARRSIDPSTGDGPDPSMGTDPGPRRDGHPGPTGAGDPDGGAGRSRRLRRPNDRMVGGVAAAVGHYLSINPWVVRVALIILALVDGIGIVVYLSAWLLLPVEGDRDTRPVTVTSNPVAQLAGFLVLLVGSILVANDMIDDLVGGRTVLALILAPFGIWLLNRRQGVPPPPPRAAATVPPPPYVPPPPGPWSAPPGPPTSTGPAADTAGWVPRARPVPTAASGPGPDHAPAGLPGPGPALIPPGHRGPIGPAGHLGHRGPIGPAGHLGHLGPMGPAGSGGSAHWARARLDRDGVPARPGREDRPPVVAFTLASMVLATAGLVVVGNAIGTGVELPVLVGAATVVVGIGIAVGAVVGRTAPLVLLSIPLLALSLSAPYLDIILTGGWGESTVFPTADGVASHRLGVGNLTVDLAHIDPDEVSDGDSLRLAVGVGQLTIYVPDDLTIDLAGSVDVGGITGVDGAGAGLGGRSADTILAGTAPGGEPLRIEAEVGVGQMQVLRHG